MDELELTKTNVLIPGEWYRIWLDDCCIEGRIIGQFIGYWNTIETLTEENGFEYSYLLSPVPEEEYWEALFNFGLLGPHWGSWYPTRIGK